MSDSDIDSDANNLVDITPKKMVKNGDDIMSVEEVNLLIKSIVQSSMHAVSVRGEISNLRINGGNTYFILKDSQSTINIVAWKRALEYKNGELVTVSGFITFYIKNGTYQITLTNIIKQGIGDIYQNYNLLKASFEQKGYFSQKRTLPEIINTVGIITSKDGAALQDILYVLSNNRFMGNVIVKNCVAQGEHCPISVRDGIKYFGKLNKTNPIDVLIITRGGGSLEDLMGYSSKEVIRAIYKSPIVTISAIGHEIDFMLSDFSADIRAPTPSIAGAIISQNHKAITTKLAEITTMLDKIKRNLDNKLELVNSNVQILKHQLDNINPVLLMSTKISKLNDMKLSLCDHLLSQINMYKITLMALDKEQSEYNYMHYMKKGYTVITANNDIVASKNDFIKLASNGSDKIKIIFADGEITMDECIKLFKNNKF
jgi:exodeoxyribonuclease VII large subunit